MLCERVRSQISLQLDGELSELERRMMEAHLIRCPDCGAFWSDVAGFTQSLRDAPLEHLQQRVIVQEPRRVSSAWVQSSVAAAVAIVSLGLAVQFAGGRSESSSPPWSIPERVEYETYDQLAAEVRQIVADGRAFDKRFENGGAAVPI